MIDTYELINNTSLPMSDETRLNMSARMQRLMRESAGLDTNEKVAERSGVSYGTVRRIRVGDVTDPQISKVEAQPFGCLSLPYSAPGKKQKAVGYASRWHLSRIVSL